MLSPNDKLTSAAIHELCEIQSAGRPILLWIGAGASRWAGYPGWEELAQKLHSKFLKVEPSYEKKSAEVALAARDLPRVFSNCKAANSQRYYSLISESLSLREATPVYARMIAALKSIIPLRIITTNVDVSLESLIGGLPCYDRSSIELVRQEFKAGRHFLYKLHGSMSDLTSSVWTMEDYEDLRSDHSFLANLEKLLDESNIIFLGYGLRDQYILDLLERNDRNSPMLGSGPHFLITSEENNDPTPPSVKKIKYLTTNNTDHRGALSALELLGSPLIAEKSVSPRHQETRASAIYIPDYFTVGTWQSSQTFTFTDEFDKPAGRASIGTGFIQDELSTVVSTAMHDLVVGLLCFDRIYFPVFGLAKLRADLGDAVFWDLIQSSAFTFVWKTSVLGIVFTNTEPDVGSIICINPRSSENPNSGKTLYEVLAEQFPTEFASESERERIYNIIEPHIRKFDDSTLANHTTLAQGALIAPKLRQCLGISDGVSPLSIPEWHVFPALRVAAVVQDAEISRHLNVASAKMPFGSDALADVAYGLAESRYTIGEYASYIVAGRFNANLGELLGRDLGLLRQLISFRESQAGFDFRGEVLDLLHTNGGREFIAAVNGRLREAIAPAILEKVRDNFIDARFASGHIPLFSHSARNGDPFQLWRQRSLRILQSVCRSRKLSSYDLCPCGSGDKLKFCCEAALNK